MRLIKKNSFIQLKNKYLPLIKSLQTGLLLVTGVAGFLSAHITTVDPWMLMALVASLFLAISGSTALNMWFDADIDSKMDRTCWRPIPAGLVSPRESLTLGCGLSALGVGLALGVDLLYGFIVFLGLFFDVLVYTMWLKRRSAWSIVWGGIAGGMPVLAGRSLAVGGVDWIGLLLSLAVLFWIPTHILTFNMRYLPDYKAAGIPTFPSVYGERSTRLVIAFSSLLAALCMAAAAYATGVQGGYLRLMAVLSSGLLLLAVGSNLRPSDQANFALFKYASLFMLLSMLVLTL